MKIQFSISVIFCGLFIAVDCAFSQTWIQQTNAPNSNWYGVASSADGNKLVAVRASGSIYTSTNSGVTWTPSVVPTGKQWQGIASSADGVKLVAADANGNGIYTSTNSGMSWISNNVPSEFWWSVASSADGTKLVAVTGIGGGPIYISTNSGNTWSQTSAPTTNYWSSVTSSADGTKLAAAQLRNATLSFGGFIYTSTNSGTTWQTNDVPFQAWESIASSADGTKLIAGGRPVAFNRVFGIYTSTNSGATWISNSVSQYIFNVSSVAISADGSKMVAVNDVANGILPPTISSIYTTTNSGITWQTNNAPVTNWQAVASSADGSKLVATTASSGIWTSQTALSPRLNTTSANTNLTLSWIVPSASFVLQQNSDLSTGNWVILTNPPVLNPANLQNEVLISPSSSNSFFRLIAR